MAFGLALQRSNHWATETPHLNHHIQLRYHRTVDSVTIAWLSRCNDPKLGMAARVRYWRKAGNGNVVGSVMITKFNVVV